MTNANRVFQFSSELFGGYRVTVNLFDFTKVEDVVHHAKQQLIAFFKANNLHLLAEKVDATFFHVHSPYNNYDDILRLTTVDDVIYVCDHY